MLLAASQSLAKPPARLLGLGGVRTILMTTSLLLATGTALAAPPKGPPGGPSYACRPYMERYCEDTPRGKGRRIACLAKHKNQLNAACRERLELMEQLLALTQKNLATSKKALAEKKGQEEKQPTPGAKPQPKWF
jgi:hypothetical protein